MTTDKALSGRSRPVGFLSRLWRKLHHPLRILRELGAFIIHHPIRFFSAMALFILGILGLLLPLMPGWVFIFAGIFVLGPESRLARWLKKQIPRVRTWLHERKLAFKRLGKR